MTPDELRSALERLDLSQVGAAKLWGLNPRTVRRWLSGDQDIPAWAPYALAGMLKGGRLRAMA